MCRGRGEEEEEANGGSFSHFEIRKNKSVLPHRAQPPRACELCSADASLYCPADHAFLCSKCDEWVHSANMLAWRHIRCFLCGTCRCPTQTYLVGASEDVVFPTIVRRDRQRRQRDSNFRRPGNSEP